MFENGESGFSFRTKLNNLYTQIVNHVASVFHFSGSYNDLADLPDLHSTVEMTHAELRALKNSNGLKIGRMYIISDFQTKYLLPEGSTIETAPVEKLILTAISVNAFDPYVKSINKPNDILKYNIDSILCEDNATTRTGKITWRQDDNGNSAYFDIRNVLVWDYVDEVNKLAFDTGCTNNTIGKPDPYFGYYNSIVFGINCRNNTVGDYCRKMKFENNVSYSHFKHAYREIILGENSHSTNADGVGNNITIGNGSAYTKIGFGCQNIHLPPFSHGNNFDTFVKNITGLQNSLYNCHFYSDSDFGSGPISNEGFLYETYPKQFIKNSNGDLIGLYLDGKNFNGLNITGQ